VFVKQDHVSVTISAASRLVDLPAEELAARVWPDVCAALDLRAPAPQAMRPLQFVGASAGRPEAPRPEKPQTWTPAPMPPWRVVKEKRATFAATAEQERLRPGQNIGPTLGLANLALAGDWTATGLPATIEGAIRSGRRAAEAILAA
jgi:hypothetical protein